MRRLAVGAVSALALGAVAVPASAADHGWHILNSVTSSGNVTVYADASCGGSSVVLVPGDSVTSLGWDAVRVSGDSFSDTIYNNPGGAFLGFREYPTGTCVNLSDNYHKLIRY